MKKLSPIAITLAVWVAILLIAAYVISTRAKGADLNYDAPTLVSALAYLKDFPEIHDVKVTSDSDAYIAFRYLAKDWEVVLESAAFIANAKLRRRVHIHFVTVEGLGDAPHGRVICTIVAYKRGIERSDCL